MDLNKIIDDRHIVAITDDHAFFGGIRLRIQAFWTTFFFLCLFFLSIRGFRLSRRLWRLCVAFFRGIRFWIQLFWTTFFFLRLFFWGIGGFHLSSRRLRRLCVLRYNRLHWGKETCNDQYGCRYAHTLQDKNKQCAYSRRQVCFAKEHCVGISRLVMDRQIGIALSQVSHSFRLILT